jgi:hypothetical protein
MIRVVCVVRFLDALTGRNRPARCSGSHPAGHPADRRSRPGCRRASWNRRHRNHRPAGTRSRHGHRLEKVSQCCYACVGNGEPYRNRPAGHHRRSGRHHRSGHHHRSLHDHRRRSNHHGSGSRHRRSRARKLCRREWYGRRTCRG